MRLYKKQNKEKSNFLKKTVASAIFLNQGRQIQFYNFWQQPFDEMYWNRWFTARPYLFKDKPDLKVGMFSVFGDRSIINETNCDINIFYSAENLKSEAYRKYSDFLLMEKKIDLSIGFEYFDDERYCRFPNWMDVLFVKQEEVNSICQRLRFPNIQDKTKFAACIASHNGQGLRDEIIDGLEMVSKVCCAGKYRHNDDSLLLEFSDNKMEYLKQFIFNVCPENANAYGYVTEKIAQAIWSGCVPVYWGSYNYPEPNVFNREAIIFWKWGGNNEANIQLINELWSSPKFRKEYLSQPRLLPTAEEYILDCMNDIEKKIERIIQNA